MTHRESKKQKKMQDQKHSSPSITDNGEVEKNKSKGTIKSNQ